MIPFFLNSRFATPITQVLLFEGDTARDVRQLGCNALNIWDCYRGFLDEAFEPVAEVPYRIIMAVPKTSMLATVCDDVCDELKKAGTDTYVARIDEDDRFGLKGKVGLLTCILLCSAGSILLNEVPISTDLAAKLLPQANQFTYTNHHLILIKKGWFHQDLRLGLIRYEGSIGYLLKWHLNSLPDNHTITDILKMMRTNCRGDDLYVVC